MPRGLNSEMQKKWCSTNMFSLKHKRSEVVFNLLVHRADNAWPQASALAYSRGRVFFPHFFFQLAHTRVCVCVCGCKDLGSASISSFQARAEKQSGLFLPSALTPVQPVTPG